MRRERLAGLCVCMLAVVGLFVPAGAGAATPHAIYQDFAADGNLSAAYSRAELEAALRSALLQGYGETGGAGLRPALEQRLSGTRGAEHTVARRATLPFTGVDLGLIGAGGAALLLLGAALRRLGQPG